MLLILNQNSNVFNLRDKITDDYGDYVRSFLTIRDEEIDRLVSQEMADGFLWPDPLIQLNPSFEPGDTLRQLVDGDVLHPECLNIFRDKGDDGSIGEPEWRTPSSGTSESLATNFVLVTRSHRNLRQLLPATSSTG